MTRPKHPRKELESLLRRAEEQGWVVKKGKKYFKMYCACASKHIKTVHLSPSNPKYLQDLLGYLRRATCWREEA